MFVIEAINVNDAYAKGLRHLCAHGELQSSRAGEVLVSPTPVSVVYSRPWECVLFDPARDANPFFHLFEALHILAGRNDARWLDQFVKDFSSRFAEDDGVQHGAYGFRWRHHFDIEGGGAPNMPDQVETVIQMLNKDPFSRRAILTMWDPVADLNVDKRDLPCNTCIYFRIRSEVHSYQGMLMSKEFLDMMVSCRSNDIVWGMFGANAVHFSFLQQYIAGRLGVEVGKYTQCSFNVHIYTNIIGKLETPVPVTKYPGTSPLGTFWESWDDDLDTFLAWTEFVAPHLGTVMYANPWFTQTATPLYLAHRDWNSGKREQARKRLIEATKMSPDWNQAALAWVDRRLARMSKAKETV